MVLETDFLISCSLKWQLLCKCIPVLAFAWSLIDEKHLKIIKKYIFHQDKRTQIMHEKIIFLVVGHSKRLIDTLTNISEAGSRLEVRRWGEYQSFCNLSRVEAKSQNWKIEVELLDLKSSIESNTEANIKLLAEFFGIKVEFLLESDHKYLWIFCVYFPCKLISIHSKIFLSIKALKFFHIYCQYILPGFNGYLFTKGEEINIKNTAKKFYWVTFVKLVMFFLFEIRSTQKCWSKYKTQVCSNLLFRTNVTQLFSCSKTFIFVTFGNQPCAVGQSNQWGGGEGK